MIDLENYPIKAHYCSIERPHGTVIEYNGLWGGLVAHMPCHGKYASTTGYRSNWVYYEIIEEIGVYAAMMEIAETRFQECSKDVDQKEKEEKEKLASSQQMSMF